MNTSATVHQFPTGSASNPAAQLPSQLPDNYTSVHAPARQTTPTLIDVSARSSFIGSFAYQGTTDGLGYLAIFFKAGHAVLYRGVPPAIPGLLKSGHTNAKSDGELSVGATYNRLIKGVYEGQAVSEAGKVAELRKLMGGK